MIIKTLFNECVYFAFVNLPEGPQQALNTKKENITKQLGQEKTKRSETLISGFVFWKLYIQHHYYISIHI